MKKLMLKLLMTVTVLALIISACAPAAAPTEAPVQPATDAPQAAPPTETLVPTPELPVDLEIWVAARVTEAGPPPEDWIAYQKIKDELNINLKVVILPGTQADQDTKINTAAASNSLPDLFFVNRDTWFKITEAGLTANVEELLPLMPERTKSHYSNPDRNLQVTYNGHMYALADPGNLVQTDAMVIRQDWLDKLGLKAPTTLDEFLTVAKAFTNDDPDGNGKKDTYGLCAFIDGSGLNGAGLGPRFDFVYGAYGVAGTWNLTNGDFGLNVRDPNYMKATQFIRTMNDEGVIDPDWPTLKKDEFRVHWKQGKCGMMQENFAALSTKSNYADFDANFPEGSWVAMDPPKGPDGASSAGVTIQPARIYAVSQRAIDDGKGPAIARLLEWMSTDGYMLLAFGQEGANYKLDASGNVSTEGLADADKWTSKESQPLTQLANMVYVFSDIELNARYPSYKAATSGRDMDPLAYYNAFQKQAYTNSSAAAIINPPSNAADFLRFYSENIVQFVLGQKTLDEAAWNEYLAGLDSLGAKDLEAAAKQTLIDAGFME
jgi:putative aldouronate transport system substrate-binding protein